MNFDRDFDIHESEMPVEIILDLYTRNNEYNLYNFLNILNILFFTTFLVIFYNFIQLISIYYMIKYILFFIFLSLKYIMKIKIYLKKLFYNLINDIIIILLLQIRSK